MTETPIPSNTTDTSIMNSSSIIETVRSVYVVTACEKILLASDRQKVTGVIFSAQDVAPVRFDFTLFAGLHPSSRIFRTINYICGDMRLYYFTLSAR